MGIFRRTNIPVSSIFCLTCLLHIYLLTYLLNWPLTTRFTDFGLLLISFQAPLLLARLRQLVTLINDRASSIWAFQRIQGRPLRWLPQIPASNNRVAGASFLHSNDMAELAQPLDISTLHKVYVVELIQLTVDFSYNSMIFIMQPTINFWHITDSTLIRCLTNLGCSQTTRTGPKILRKTSCITAWFLLCNLPSISGTLLTPPISDVRSQLALDWRSYLELFSRILSKLLHHGLS